MVDSFVLLLMVNGKSDGSGRVLIQELRNGCAGAGRMADATSDETSGASVVAGSVSEHAEGEPSGALVVKDRGTEDPAQKISNTSLQTQTLAESMVKKGWSLSSGGSIYGGEKA
jgi:hypothetical protein